MIKRKLFLHNSIKHKFLFATIILFITFILFTTYIWYSNSSKEAEKNATEYITSMMQVSNDNLETNLKDINNIVQLLTINSDTYISTNIINILNGNKKISAIDTLKYRREAEDFMISLCHFKHYLYGVTVSDLEGNSLDYGIVMPFHELKLQEWYSTLINAKGETVIIPPHPSNNWYTSEGDKVLSIGKPIINDDEVIGFVIAHIKNKILSDMFSTYVPDNEMTFIIDNNSSEFIFKSEYEEPILNFNESKLRKLNSKFKSDSGSFYINLNNKDFFVVYIKSHFTNWTTVGLIPRNKLLKSFSVTRNKVLSLSVLFCIIAILIIYFMTSLLTRNLLHLNNSLKLINKDNLEISVDIHSNDEIGELYQQFNYMLIRIKELINEIQKSESEKRVSELRALQSQINPHFLYNTLNTIKYLSVLQGVDNIKMVSEALSRLMHINMDVRSFITIEEENQYLRCYLNIQEYRYTNNFSYTFIIEDDVKNYMIPKLLLQPIVENCLIHGITPLKSQGVISVKIYQDHNTLKLRIQDNGIGIDEETIEKLLNSKIQSDRIGLHNVISRIKMYFGSKYGLSIYSQQNIYTIVELSIPLITKEDVQKYV